MRLGLALILQGVLAKRSVFGDGSRCMCSRVGKLKADGQMCSRVGKLKADGQMCSRVSWVAPSWN